MHFPTSLLWLSSFSFSKKPVPDSPFPAQTGQRQFKRTTTPLSIVGPPSVKIKDVSLNTFVQVTIVLSWTYKNQNGISQIRATFSSLADLLPRSTHGPLFYQDIVIHITSSNPVRGGCQNPHSTLSMVLRVISLTSVLQEGGGIQCSQTTTDTLKHESQKSGRWQLS